MKRLDTEIHVSAPAAKVWKILTNIHTYHHWNPFIKNIQGTLEPGERIQVRIQPPGGNIMTFTPRLLSVDPEREIRWKGRLLLPGLFDGEHRLAIEPIDDQTVRFIQSETFSGFMVPLMTRQIDTSIRKGFEAMNTALKKRAEEHHSSGSSPKESRV
jgi:hypothetical protein